MKIRSIGIVLGLIALLAAPVSFAAESHNVVAYYFHTTKRCSSCHKIQQFIEEALQKGFSQEISSGKLAYKVVNVEEKENEHYVADYGLFTKSVILSIKADGKEVEFKNLDKIWQLLNSKEKFISYIENEVRESLQ